MKKPIVIFLSLFVMVALACNLGSNSTPQAPGGTSSTPQGNGTQPPVIQPAGTPPAIPVSINDGLSSLNSYQMTISYKSTGPDPTESSTMATTIQRSMAQDARYMHMDQTTVKKGGADPSTSQSDMYEIGNDQCSGSGKDWSWTTMAPNQTEMLDLTKNMLGLNPLIDTPTFVAPETVNGISTNHFTFKVSGLGVKSGAQVNTNQGDYWLAVDGQYIVKYTLVIETSMDPKTNVLHEEISIELNQINQPVNIAFPQGCLDASLVTPTP